MQGARVARAVTRWTLLVSGFVVALLYLNSAVACAWVAGGVDACLDGGGRWNAAAFACEK
jgi:hypothetical protein